VARAELPFVDEHTIAIDAAPSAVWPALVDVTSGSFGGRGSERVAAVLGCEQRAIAGAPGEVGSTIPGFRVAEARSPALLALEGRHRFSTYTLTFRVDPDGDGSRLRAETRAEFPGLHGSAYRALVIGTGGHVVVVRRLLGSVKDRALHGRDPV
jgi:Polyketide cyclase / dehydrase and lipid transport